MIRATPNSRHILSLRFETIFSTVFAIAIAVGLALVSPAVLPASASTQAPTKSRAATRPYYPCRECHTDGSRAIRPSATQPHERIKLQHAPDLSCTDCHEPANWGKLSMLTDTYIEYGETPELCGQCHGIIKRDWDQGMHGKTVGGWQVKRQRLSCAECHNPHNPKFPRMKALPHPTLPRLGIPKHATGEVK